MNALADPGGLWTPTPQTKIILIECSQKNLAKSYVSPSPLRDPPQHPPWKFLVPPLKKKKVYKQWWYFDRYNYLIRKSADIILKKSSKWYKLIFLSPNITKLDQNNLETKCSWLIPQKLNSYIFPWVEYVQLNPCTLHLDYLTVVPKSRTEKNEAGLVIRVTVRDTNDAIGNKVIV